MDHNTLLCGIGPISDYDAWKLASPYEDDDDDWDEEEEEDDERC